MTRAAGPSRRWGDAAAGWAAAFAVTHLYWALGGNLGLAESAGRELAEERPAWFVAMGLYGVAVALFGAAALATCLARASTTRRTGRWLRVLGAGVAAVLLLRAIAVEALLLADVGYGSGDITSDQRWWTLVVWNPWFLLGGITFAMATLAARPAGARP